MKSIFLTSGPQFSIKNENGDRKAVRLANSELVENLKKEIEGYNNLVFICSSPDDYEKNEKYASTIAKSLSLSGLKFNFVDLIDSRNWLFSKSLITNADFIVLLGGNPTEQMEFFNSIELKDKLKRYKGCLLGISAGSINLARDVYCSADEDVLETVRYKGLGLVDISIEPHFDIEDKNRINSTLLPDSKNKSFIGLPDDSYIIVKKDAIRLYGEAYYLNNGELNKITDKNLNNL